MKIPKQVSLIEIFREFPLETITSVPDVRINGVIADSRLAGPGDLFVAIAGGTTDGHRFIPDALSRGVSAVVGTQPQTGLPVPYIRVQDSRQALAHLVAAYYGYPARQMTVIGVTGTDGKTTTANLIYKILEMAGLPVGMISTVNAVIGDQVLDTGFHVTTPDATDVQRYLAQMVSAGLSHVVLEATSHGLAQNRVDACEFDVGVVTNITHEHLDFHGDYQAYRAAKARLISGLADTLPKPWGNLRLAALNMDDSSFDYLASIPDVRQVTYGFHPGADVRAQEVFINARGLRFVTIGPDFRIPIESNLVGNFNVSNCLAAISATVVGLGVQPGVARAGIAALRGVPGRMDRFDLGQDFIAVVDFAHTPNALRCSLEAARHMSQGRVIAVFGSAGLRDRAKRRMMAQVSADLADLTVFTAEDPRTESLEAILGEMAAGAGARGGVEGQNYWIVPDRGEAIRFAVSLACPGDVVIACGKGHEQSMCFGETEYPWDDRLAMRAALAEHLGIPGPQMPYLPTQDLQPPYSGF